LSVDGYCDSSATRIVRGPVRFATRRHHLRGGPARRCRVWYV